jgi:methylamine dehydrogenase light chain
MNEIIKLDRLAERATVALSERGSRRAFLAKVGRAILVISGVGAVTASGVLQPVDRRVALAASCTDWSKCAMHGYPCENCGGSASSCPSGCSAGSSWTGCCSFNANCYYYVTFQDCCGCSQSGCSNWCANSSEPNWCAGAGGGTYTCTLSIIGCLCYDGGNCLQC